MGGRVTRYPLRSTEKTDETGHHRDVQLGHRWMDAMSVDYSCLFPTGMLSIGLHPQKEMEVQLCWAYNRWLTEKVLPEFGGRFYSMLSLPFNDPDESLRQVETFGDSKHVGGFMVTTVRNTGVHENAYMKVYRAIEERGLVLSFHSGPNWAEPIFKTCNRFLSVHALGFSWYNILHCTNWVINGMGERFPKLPVIWIEFGLAWVPFLMQKLDHEYMLRPSEAPLLKKKPSDYMRDMYYSSQPMEIQDMQGAGVHVPHDQCGDAADVLLGLPALGLRPAEHDLRPAVPVREGQAQHPRRHRGAPVQAAAAQRQAEREPEEVRQYRRIRTTVGVKQNRLPERSGRRFVFGAVGWAKARNRNSLSPREDRSAVPTDTISVSARGRWHGARSRACGRSRLVCARLCPPYGARRWMRSSTARKAATITTSGMI